MIEVEEPQVQTDASIIELSQARPAAFETLFDRHHDAIWRYACRRAGAAVADEVASETFLRAFDARARYDLGQASARPWLYGIATNVLRKHARAERRRRRAYEKVAERDVVDDGLDGVAGRLDARALRPAVRTALERLRPADREALLLLALTELDYEAIAVATDAPVGTVRSRIHRARRQLTAALGAGSGPGQDPPPERNQHEQER